jgi:hypothetical protein
VTCTIAAVTASILREHAERGPKTLDQVWLRPPETAHPLAAPPFTC